MGPFSITQNPLYFFSTVGAIGVGLMYGSVLAAAALGLASFVVFRVTARKEAEFLFESSVPPIRPTHSGRRGSGQTCLCFAIRMNGCSQRVR